jgi:hypothetical protein
LVWLEVLDFGSWLFLLWFMDISFFGFLCHTILSVSILGYEPFQQCIAFAVQVVSHIYFECVEIVIRLQVLIYTLCATITLMRHTGVQHIQLNQ